MCGRQPTQQPRSRTVRTLQDPSQVRQHLLADPLVPHEFRQRDRSLDPDGQVGVGDAIHEEVERVLEGLQS